MSESQLLGWLFASLPVAILLMLPALLAPAWVYLTADAIPVLMCVGILVLVVRDRP